MPMCSQRAGYVSYESSNGFTYQSKFHQCVMKRRIFTRYLFIRVIHAVITVSLRSVVSVPACRCKMNFDTMVLPNRQAKMCSCISETRIKLDLSKKKDLLIHLYQGK